MSRPPETSRNAMKPLPALSEYRKSLFWKKVDKNGPISNLRPDLGACWLWTAQKHSVSGYGLFWVSRGKTVKAHRVAFEEEYGPVPDGLEPDHLCRNRDCVRPTHLEAVTSGENTLRGFSLPAINSRKTECLRGHPLSGNNLRIGRRSSSDNRPARICIACRGILNAARKR